MAPALSVRGRLGLHRAVSHRDGEDLPTGLPAAIPTPPWPPPKQRECILRRVVALRPIARVICWPLRTRSRHVLAKQAGAAMPSDDYGRWWLVAVKMRC